MRKYELIDQVKNALELYCDKGRNEEIKTNYVLSPEHKNERTYFLFDIYFPKGISKLHIPENSFLLIRRSLITDTIYRTNVTLEKWREIYPNSKAYLLYEENKVISDEVFKEAEDLKQTQVYQIDYFLNQKVKKIMKHLIDKDILAAEIEKRKKHNKEWLNWCKENRTSIIAACQAIQEDKDIMSLINTLDTLEVKEVETQKGE